MNAKSTVAFVVNGDVESAMGERARAFAKELAGDFDCHVVYRQGGKLAAAWRMVRELWTIRPHICYVLDMAASGVAAAGVYRLVTGTPWIVDTGDAIVALGKALGRGPLAMFATRVLELFALRASSGVVVRGSYHKELLARRGITATFIPDGVDLEQFAPPKDQKPKGPTDPLVIGMVGSVVWSPVRESCYGWELLEIVKQLQGTIDWPVRGIMVGDGSGLPRLKERCQELGIEGLVEFAGRVPYAELPGWLHRMDICLSTQTNDVVGWVRTTGKLPLYLAAGRFVLASRVGEAARVLPEEMLVDGEGIDGWARAAERAAVLLVGGGQIVSLELAQRYDYHTAGKMKLVSIFSNNIFKKL
jgi:glycosyltransferase involved in cell wall biosynthesis